MTITFTKEQVESGRVMPLIEDRQFLWWQMVEAAVEGKAVPYEIMRLTERIEKEIKESGYKGAYLDVAVYAEARFQQDEDIP